MYQFFENFWKFGTVDFDQEANFEVSFGSYLISHWKGLLIFTLLKGISSVYYIMSPLLLVLIIQSRSYIQLGYYLLAAVIIQLLFTLSNYLELRWLARIQQSIRVSAQRLLLEADPIEHTTLSHGKVFSKFTPLTIGLYDIINQITNEFGDLVITLITVSATFIFFDRMIGGVLVFLFVIQIVILGLIRNILAKAFKAESISRRDESHETSNTLVTQKEFIRTAFASHALFERFKIAFARIIVTIRTSNMTIRTLGSFVETLNILTVVIILALLFARDFEAITILALSAVLSRSIFAMSATGRFITSFTERWIDMNDAWEFIQRKSKNSFPVLSKSSEEIPFAKDEESIIIKLDSVSFGYPLGGSMLTNQHLTISTTKNSQNKLIGIIGPSGTGKTTLLSILGGQIKPDSGHVYIQGVDIYEVGDDIRAQLIALQMQSSTSLRGKLKYNVKFGIPEEVYTDEECIDVLERVGLWDLFESKKGLDTLIGEKGLNLSGGQRQRLNFASLYLRAKYFKPYIILIDEPTSSLDEVSERAITAMILELAAQSLTLVVAHRLVTIQDAYGIIDASLFQPEHEIEIYTQKELLTKSTYYQQLIEGKTQLDE